MSVHSPVQCGRCGHAAGDQGLVRINERGTLGGQNRKEMRARP